MPTVTSAVHGDYDPFSPPALRGVFAFTIQPPTVEIAAPPAVVWAVLTDFAAYPDWCPFTRRIETELVVGHHVDLHVTWDASRLGEPERVQREQIALVEPELAVAWGMSMAGGALRTERTQALQPFAHGTRYVSYDRFAGPLAPLVRLTHGARMEAGFAAVSRALKARVESLSRAS